MLTKKKLKDKTPLEIQKLLADAFLNISVDEDKLYNPLDWPAEASSDPLSYITYVMTRPEYFSFFCSEILNVDLLPFQGVMLKELWQRKFPMLIGSRGMSKSYMLAVYNLLRIVMIPNRKVLMAGAAFRQSKVVFNYMETIWGNAPLLRDIASSYGGKNWGPNHQPDMWTFRIGSSTATAVPVGPGGEKIRGQRANDLQVDEFNSLAKEIFETVMAGFTAVSANPVGNVKIEAARRMAERLEEEYGMIIETQDEFEDGYILPNQLLIAGTAGYSFQHYFDYWQDWHDIICSKGDKKKLERYLAKKSQGSEQSDDEILEALNWEDFGIIRIPYELIPKGFMDASQVARAKATMHAGTYLCEYASCFADDSNGFFKRSIIENATVSPKKMITHEGYEHINFNARLMGDPNRKYIYGIDPASESDNFSITVLELHKNHRRVVYVWTTNKEQQKQEIKDGYTSEDDYYAYCILKIRDLMKRFPCERLMVDAGGGGVTLREGLMNERLIRPGEQKIYEAIDEDKERETDMMLGLHILEMCQFSKYEWIQDANNGLRFDIERKRLLFPFFDAVALSIAEGQDKAFGRVYDNLENCILEIEETKNELTSIVITQTPSGRERWDTPETTLPGGKKGRMKKDRYSSLLIANMGARIMINDITFYPEGTIGGFAGSSKAVGGKLFTGNEEFNKSAEDVYSLYG